MILSGSFEEYAFVLFDYPVIKRDPIICQTLFQRFEDQLIHRSVHQHQVDDPVSCHRAYRVDRLLFLVSQSGVVDIGVIQQPRQIIREARAGQMGISDGCCQKDQHSTGDR